MNMTVAPIETSCAGTGLTTGSRPMKRVLVVDDNQWMHQAIMGCLKEHGAPITVSTAGSGSEALDMMQAGDFDMLVADVDLPDMNGYQLIDRVRLQRPTLSFMVTTDDCPKKVVKLLTPPGGYRWIEKPHDARAIAILVRHELDRLA